MNLKLNLGSGNNRYKDYLSVDLYDSEADVLADITDLSIFQSETVESIVAFQVIEHVPYNKSEQMFKEWFRVLKPGGDVWIECPDIKYICEKILKEGISEKWQFNIYGQYYRPWDLERYGESCYFHPGSMHHQGWTFDRLVSVCSPIGFSDFKLETDKLSKYPECLSVRFIKGHSA